MSKEFNYKEELKRMFKSLGGNGNGCGCVDCNDCPLDSGKFENKESRCAGIGYEEEMIEIVRKWSEEHTREIDWRKVPRDTPVKVRDQVWDEWQERKFAWHRADIFECRFVTFGLYEEAYFGDTENLDRWKYCKLAYGVEPKEEWYKD